MNDFTHLTDLALARLGGRVLSATDEFFAPRDRLLVSDEPVFEAGRYTDRGKWMDGWETRRRRDDGHDWCVIRLGASGVIRGVNVDTRHFNGNQPESCSIEACACDADEPDDRVAWRTILGRSPLQPDAPNLFEVTDGERVTHLRLHIFPDGGVARLRVYGEPRLVWPQSTDLVAAGHGGRVVACSDECFSAPRNLLWPDRAENMGDGWETRRRRGPGHDWCVIRLGCRGTVEAVEVDTAHFKGNYPDRCSVEACDEPGDLAIDAATWRPLVAETALSADHLHRFEVDANEPVTHVRLNIFPDGGVSRLRVHGRPA